MFELKKSTEELCLTALKIDAKLEGKLTYSFPKMIRRVWQIFVRRLKNIDFILESKMEELNQEKYSNQPDRPDLV